MSLPWCEDCVETDRGTMCKCYQLAGDVAPPPPRMAPNGLPVECETEDVPLIDGGFLGLALNDNMNIESVQPGGPEDFERYVGDEWWVDAVNGKVVSEQPGWSGPDSVVDLVRGAQGSVPVRMCKLGDRPAAGFRCIEARARKDADGRVGIQTDGGTMVVNVLNGDPELQRLVGWSIMSVNNQPVTSFGDIAAAVEASPDVVLLKSCRM